MSLDDLAPELVSTIYCQLFSIQDVVNLSLTCRKIHSMLPTSQRLAILFSVADHEMGPVQDIIQLVTENATQATHLHRSPALSSALLTQISVIGKTAKKWEELYTIHKWGEAGYIYRRCLTAQERRILRQTVYRYWLYSQVYHNRSYPRTMRLSVTNVHERCTLLRQWSTEELVHLLDLRIVFENILQSEICPTDGEVYWRTGRDAHFREDSNARLNMSFRHLDHHSVFHSAHEFNNRTDFDSLPATQQRDRLMTGWGDDISQYHTVQSMLKLDPSQLLWLHNHAINKRDVESFINQAGADWFWDNGETMLHSIILVLQDRGIDYQIIEQAIRDGVMGIAVNSPLTKYLDTLSSLPTVDRCY